MEKTFGGSLDWGIWGWGESSHRRLAAWWFFVGQEFPDPKNHGTGDPRPLRKTHVQTLLLGYIRYSDVFVDAFEGLFCFKAVALTGVSYVVLAASIKHVVCLFLDPIFLSEEPIIFLFWCFPLFCTCSFFCTYIQLFPKCSK